MGVKCFFKSYDDFEDNLNNIKNFQTNTIVDISNFRILKHCQKDKFLVVKIRYNNCGNFEGEKILIYKNITIKDLENMKIIDPHFSNENISPIIRIIPTNDGWKMALELSEYLAINEYK